MNGTRSAPSRGVTSLMRLREIMSSRVITVESKEAASVAWSRMQRQRIRHLVVTENRRLVGVLSERDLGGRSGVETRKGRVVQDLMTPRVASAEPKTTLRQAAHLMRGRLVGCLPVLDEDRLVGIATATDVLEELGRGSTRPTIRAERRSLRLPASSKQRGGRPVVRRRSRARRKTARGRPRIPDSKKRAPLQGRLPRPFKRESGRTDAPLVPAHIRALGVELGQDDRTYIRRKLGMKLGKFATSIERVSIRLEMSMGPAAASIRYAVSRWSWLVFRASSSRDETSRSMPRSTVLLPGRSGAYGEACNAGA